MAEPPCEKSLAPKRKCKFNDDCKRDFAWIAKLPDCGMAQCSLRLTSPLSSGGRTDRNKTCIISTSFITILANYIYKYS